MKKYKKLSVEDDLTLLEEYEDIRDREYIKRSIQ